MYLPHWKLVRRSFDERVDASWFFGSGSHQNALLKLRCAVQQRVPIVLLVGGVGHGKSLLATTLAERLPSDTHRIVPFVPVPSTAHEVVNQIQEELHRAGRSTVGGAGLHPRSQGEAAEEINRSLGTQEVSHRHTLVLLDGGECLSEDEIKKLAHALRRLTVPPASSLTTVLVGNTQLLVQVHRISRAIGEEIPHCLLDAMSSFDTAAYISHRLRMAGGDPALFAPAAIELIHDLSGGVPRRINRLGDLSLLIGFAQARSQVTEDHVWTAQSELRTLTSTRTAFASHTRHWRPLLSNRSSA